MAMTTGKNNIFIQMSYFYKVCLTLSNCLFPLIEIAELRPSTLVLADFDEGGVEGEKG